jgi:hypothetical protein
VLIAQSGRGHDEIVSASTSHAPSSELTQ